MGREPTNAEPSWLWWWVVRWGLLWVGFGVGRRLCRCLVLAGVWCVGVGCAGVSVVMTGSFVLLPHADNDVLLQ